MKSSLLADETSRELWGIFFLMVEHSTRSKPSLSLQSHGFD